MKHFCLPILSLTVFAGAPLTPKAHGGNTTAAAVAFRNCAGSPACASPDKIQSDASNTYQNGVSGVSSSFVANGNLTLDLSNSTRRLSLDFSTPDAALNASQGILNPPTYTGLFAATLTNTVLNPDGSCCSSTGLLGMAVGTSQPSVLSIAFTDLSGKSCAVHFAKGVQGAVYANTTDAVATRIDSNNWTLTTSPSDVAVLVCTSKRMSTVEGYYFLPTQFTVTKQ